MGRGGTNDIDLGQLRRAVTVLLALARLVEGLAGRSAAVRMLVLWLVRPGEAIARDYLADLAGRDPDRPDPIAAVFADDSPAGALALARRFRAIAASLLAIAEACFDPCPPPAEKAAPVRLFRSAGRAMTGVAILPAILDTS